MFQTATHKKLFIGLFDEAWVNISPKFEIQSFNQNWLFAGVGYHVTPYLTLQTGYLHQWITYSATRFESNSTLQVVVVHQFSLRKKESK